MEHIEVVRSDGMRLAGRLRPRPGRNPHWVTADAETDGPYRLLPGEAAVLVRREMNLTAIPDGPHSVFVCDAEPLGSSALRVDVLILHGPAEAEMLSLDLLSSDSPHDRRRAHRPGSGHRGPRRPGCPGRGGRCQTRERPLGFLDHLSPVAG